MLHDMMNTIHESMMPGSYHLLFWGVVVAVFALLLFFGLVVWQTWSVFPVVWCQEMGC